MLNPYRVELHAESEDDRDESGRKWLTLRKKYMRKREKYGSIVEMCQERGVVARFGDKWSLLVLLLLEEHDVLRFGELGREIPDVSSRVLSSTLRRLEADGLVRRTVYPQVPPRVEYCLTPIGRSLIPLIRQLTDWALENMASIVAHRRRFEEEGEPLPPAGGAE